MHKLWDSLAQYISADKLMLATISYYVNNFIFHVFFYTAAIKLGMKDTN